MAATATLFEDADPATRIGLGMTCVDGLRGVAPPSMIVPPVEKTPVFRMTPAPLDRLREYAGICTVYSSQSMLIHIAGPVATPAFQRTIPLDTGTSR